MSDLQAELDSLIEQATKERSHYYAASVAKRCKKRIEELEEQVAQHQGQYVCLPKVAPDPYDERNGDYFRHRDLVAKVVDAERQLAQARKVLDHAKAAIWDSYYGNGIAAEYARKVSSEIDAAIKRSKG